MFQSFSDILAKGILLHAEMKRGTSRGESEAEIGIACNGSREEEEMGNAERTSHGGVVS